MRFYKAAKKAGRGWSTLTTFLDVILASESKRIEDASAKWK